MIAFIENIFTPRWAGRIAAGAATVLMATVLMATAPCGARAETTSPPIAIMELDYLDTSGEIRDQSATHRALLERFAAALREDLQASQKYVVVGLTCDPDPCSISQSDPSELLAAARHAGARFLLFGGVHKMSTLVQWAKVQVVDVATDKLVFDRLLTFRGDDADAWRHAEGFLAKELTSQTLVP
ncbi:MAG: DUF3280 domain-containing protein [Pseudomonadota bacterium]|nr:DUF3280 domain-containing protein [Pseudomonadota bacterium]